MKINNIEGEVVKDNDVYILKDKTKFECYKWYLFKTLFFS